jgi:hypothetical protein
MKIENILNEEEKTRLQKFLDDPVMKEAVKKILLAGIYTNGTLQPGVESDFAKNWAFGLLINERGEELSQTNDQLGQRLRAAIEGVKFLETGFIQLEKFKIINIDVSGKENQAR